MTQDIVFQGLIAPLRLNQAEKVAALFPAIATGWPYGIGEADPDRLPFFTIQGQAASERYTCENHVEPAPPRQWDALSAACDAVAALAQALPAQDGRLVCLHAAGVALRGHLLVFPNLRRAGKSTLAAALAQAGHTIFSDDVLPLFVPTGGVVRGLAMGIAPRLRLPVPQTAGQGFCDWVAATPGPENRQYKYLSLTDQPAHGESLPVAAFVILDRHDTPVPSRLDPVSPNLAMDALLQQNFTRDRHSGEVLALMADLLVARPVYRLTYSSLRDAVDCLNGAFPTPAGPSTHIAGEPARQFRPAPAEAEVRPMPPPDTPLVQRGNVSSHLIGDTLYLADPEGRAIHRMDPLAAAIWDTLESPATADDLAALLAEAFPTTDPDRIAADIRHLVVNLAAWGLVAAA